MSDLEVAVDDTHVVAVCYHAHNCADECCCVLLRVVTLLHNGVKQLTAITYLHGQAHIALVLIHTLQEFTC